VAQCTLFGRGQPSFNASFCGIKHIELAHGAWLDHLPGFVHGHETVFRFLVEHTHWNHHQRPMYDRVVDVPRLTASLPDDGPGHPVLWDVSTALAARYGRPLTALGLARYRDGNDSVAFHGDRLKQRTDAVVAIVSVGARRRFLLRPAGGGRSLSFDMGWGDLLVMGGTCQETWEHGVPKSAGAGSRISIQFRERSREAQQTPNQDPEPT
jgi:alkylated DNA repair dioxygenase AlkB